jgi:hypothetical protein
MASYNIGYPPAGITAMTVISLYLKKSKPGIDTAHEPCRRVALDVIGNFKKL